MASPQKHLALFLLLLCWVLPLPVEAQIGASRKDLAIGVGAGYIMNRVSFNPTIKQAWKGGYSVGVTFRYTCEKYFATVCAVQAELNYANMGWQEVIELSDDTYSRDMHYLQMPLLARLAWGREHKGFQLFFLLGPQLGYFLSEKEQMGGTWSDETLNLRPNKITMQYGRAAERKFEYGISGGLGVELSTRHAGHFQVEGRYFYGLSDIFKNSKKDPFGRSANGAIYIKAAYLFDLLRTPDVK